MIARTFVLAFVVALAGPGLIRAAEPGSIVHTTANFAVEAADEELAKQIAKQAEKHRHALAVAWLGRELPPWKKRCSVKVSVVLGPPGGVTHFNYEPDADGKSCVCGIAMELSGPLDVIVRGVLPHEAAHAVLTTHFGCPVPRWADEGLAILGEPDDIQAATDQRLREFLSQERTLSVPRLLELKDYPDDRYTVYAQGHSLARYLLTCRPKPDAGRATAGRRALVRFVESGLAEGWDSAAKQVYGFKSIEALETGWSEWLKSNGSRYPQPVTISSER
jgi:hypothetical protein